MKDYPLEVRELGEFEGYRIVAYMTKGHHDKKEFASEVKSQYKADINTDCVRHSWGKVVPASGISQCVLHELNRPVKGSFPMTYIDV